MFLKAEKENCRNLVKLINMYCQASRQQVNLQKSSVDDPRTYLGVPAMWGRSKSKGLAYVKDRILAKIQGWKHVLLLQTGWEVLIKVVVQAIPTYPMNLFKFPASICK